MTNLHLPPLPDAAVTQQPHGSLVKAKRLAFAALAFITLGASYRYIDNDQQAAALAADNQQSLQRTVLIAKASPGNLTRKVVLPTTLRGNTETSIHARSSGYLAHWYKDIGDPVKKGELMALIDAPEQTQELTQVRATRQQILARRDLAQLTLTRWESLRQHDGVTQQDLEEKRSALAQANADLAAVDASVSRLQQLESFRRIVAPFEGVVTRRDIEVGDLISASGESLFTLVQINPIRLSVWVPQLYANDLIAGSTTTVRLNESTNSPIEARIDRIAGSIDPRTRARQVDLVIDNDALKLLPGAYAEVDLTLSSGQKALIVPASVLKITDEGVKIGVVDNNQRISFPNVKLGRDLGREVEVLAGINEGDTLVVSPSDLLTEGEIVKTLAWTGKINTPVAASSPQKAVSSEKPVAPEKAVAAKEAAAP